MEDRGSNVGKPIGSVEDYVDVIRESSEELINDNVSLTVSQILANENINALLAIASAVREVTEVLTKIKDELYWVNENLNK